MDFRASSIAYAGLVLVLSFLLKASTGFPPDLPPVVIVVFDELPTSSLLTLENEIDVGLFPNFAALSGDSTWFRNTSTVGVFTKDVMPSILTGAYPANPDWRQRNILTQLGFRSGTPNTPRAELGPGFGAFDHAERAFPITSMMKMIETDAAVHAGQPALYFAHVVLPHSPWRYLPSGQRYEEDEPEPGEVDIPGPGKGWTDDPWLVTQAQQRHLLQLGIVDRLLGALVSTAKRSGIYDESLFIVTADHGIAFDPGFPKRRTAARSVGEIAYVPLFIKMPHQSGGTVEDRPAVVIDIVPTMSEILGIGTGELQVNGMSLLGEIPGDRMRTIEGRLLHPAGHELTLAVARKHGRFGRIGEALDPYMIGPGATRDLIGSSVGLHGAVRSACAKAGIDTPDVYESASPTDPRFPAAVQGHLQGIGGPCCVAVIVNGRVAAVTRTFSQGAREAFYAIVPPTAFHEAPNEVEARALWHFGAGCAPNAPQDPSTILRTERTRYTDLAPGLAGGGGESTR